MKVSFLVTYYNQQQYVFDSLSSIWNIKKDFEYEVLVSDDGSTDDTLSEIEKWRAKFGSKLKVFSFSRNDGVTGSVLRVSNARKKLFKEATGDFVCLLDGDDCYCDSDFVNYAINVMANYEIAVVMNDYEAVYKDHVEKHRLSGTVGNIETAQYLLNMYTPAGACVFRNVEDDSFVGSLTFDDNDIVIYFLNFGGIWYSGRSVYAYRQNAESAWNSKNRIQQACLNAIGADVGAALNPENAGLIYYRYRLDILFLFAYKDELLKFMGKDELNNYILQSNAVEGVSHVAFNFAASSSEDKEMFIAVVEAIKEAFPNDYYAVVEERPLDGKNDDISSISSALENMVSYLDNVNRFSMGMKDTFEKEMMFIANGVIANRLRLKSILKEKINVVFIANRPEVWNSEKSFYEALAADERFDVKILAVRVKKDYSNNKEEYVDEGAEWFCKEYNAINAYNSETGLWVDLRSLKPDYVFYQQPYNVILYKQYRSEFVSKYAKVCLIPYGMQIAGGDIFESVTPIDFLNTASFYFTSEKYNEQDVRMRLDESGNYFTQTVSLGIPRLDQITIQGKQKTAEKKEKICALWLPRWCVEEGNCHFFDYKDLFVDYCEKNKDFELILRQHPQASREYIKKGLMSLEEQNAYNEKLTSLPNASIDLEKDYLKAFEKSDILIADMTSLMGEYFVTEKPIIYCYRVDCFTRFGDEMGKGFYYVRNWDELVSTIEMLKRGEDPLKEERLRLKKELLGDYEKKNIGFCIKEFIKNDALK